MAGTDSAAFLFVYGTLRRSTGHPMNALLRLSRFIGAGYAAGRLYDLGRYPGMVPPRAPGDRVRGEVYRLRRTSLTLQRLDDYEGCSPFGDEPCEYRRVRTAAWMDDGRVLSVWAYLFNGAVNARGYIPSGDYLKTCGLRRHGGVSRPWVSRITGPGAFGATPSRSQKRRRP